MRIRTIHDPFRADHVSMVDIVRRNDPPPYARSAKCINWMNLGGIVWTFVWLRVVILLLLFAMLFGLVYGPFLGVPYSLPSHRLRSVDLARLTAGQPVRDVRGSTVIDPITESVTIYTVHRNAELTLKYQSTASTPDAGSVIILLASGSLDYEQVVTALDELHDSHPGARIWIAPADLSASQAKSQ